MFVHAVASLHASTIPQPPNSSLDQHPGDFGAHGIWRPILFNSPRFFPPGSNFSFGATISAASTSSVEIAILLFKFVAAIVLPQRVEQVPAPPLNLPFISLSPQLLPVPRAASARMR